MSAASLLHGSLQLRAPGEFGDATIDLDQSERSVSAAYQTCLRLLTASLPVPDEAFKKIVLPQVGDADEDKEREFYLRRATA